MKVPDARSLILGNPKLQALNAPTWMLQCPRCAGHVKYSKKLGNFRCDAEPWCRITWRTQAEWRNAYTGD